MFIEVLRLFILKIGIQVSFRIQPKEKKNSGEDIVSTIFEIKKNSHVRYLNYLLLVIKKYAKDV